MSWILPLLMCFSCAMTASRKGFSPILWFLAGGPLGMVLLWCLPAANKPEQSPEESRRAASVGNGAAIALLVIVGAVLIWLFSISTQ